MQQLPTTAAQKEDYERWKRCIQQLSSFENVYMKLSGAFSEIGDQSSTEPWPVSTIVDRIAPWTQHVLECFTPRRIMFGSDWPVCNVGGPGDAISWGLWREVVVEILERAKLSKEDKDRIWFGTAIEAYSLDFKE
jgi:L-rhamnono-1,4-lactonase